MRSYLNREPAIAARYAPLFWFSFADSGLDLISARLRIFNWGIVGALRRRWRTLVRRTCRRGTGHNILATPFE